MPYPISWYHNSRNPLRCITYNLYIYASSVLFENTAGSNHGYIVG